MYLYIYPFHLVIHPVLQLELQSVLQLDLHLVQHLVIPHVLHLVFPRGAARTDHAMFHSPLRLEFIIDQLQITLHCTVYCELHSAARNISLAHGTVQFNAVQK